MRARTATFATKRKREEREVDRGSASVVVARSQIEVRPDVGCARWSSAFLSASLIRLMWQGDKKRIDG